MDCEMPTRFLAVNSLKQEGGSTLESTMLLEDDMKLGLSQARMSGSVMSISRRAKRCWSNAATNTESLRCKNCGRRLGFSRSAAGLMLRRPTVLTLARSNDRHPPCQQPTFLIPADTGEDASPYSERVESALEGLGYGYIADDS